MALILDTDPNNAVSCNMESFGKTTGPNCDNWLWREHGSGVTRIVSIPFQHQVPCESVTLSSIKCQGLIDEDITVNGQSIKLSPAAAQMQCNWSPQIADIKDQIVDIKCQYSRNDPSQMTEQLSGRCLVYYFPNVGMIAMFCNATSVVNSLDSLRGIAPPAPPAPPTSTAGPPALITTHLDGGPTTALVVGSTAVQQQTADVNPSVSTVDGSINAPLSSLASDQPSNTDSTLKAPATGSVSSTAPSTSNASPSASQGSSSPQSGGLSSGPGGSNHNSDGLGHDGNPVPLFSPGISQARSSSASASIAATGAAVIGNAASDSSGKASLGVIVGAVTGGVIFLILILVAVLLLLRKRSSRRNEKGQEPDMLPSLQFFPSSTPLPGTTIFNPQHEHTAHGYESSPVAGMDFNVTSLKLTEKVQLDEGGRSAVKEPTALGNGPSSIAGMDVNLASRKLIETQFKEGVHPGVGIPAMESELPSYDCAAETEFAGKSANKNRKSKRI